MNDKMEKLYAAIEKKFDNYIAAKELFGVDNPFTIRILNQLESLQEAFEIVFDISYVDYFVDRCNSEYEEVIQ